MDVLFALIVFALLILDTAEMFWDVGPSANP